jgi:hypothetical protein
MKYLIFFCFAFVLLLLPMDTAVAQVGGFVTCDGTDCNSCHFVSMINTIIRWLLGIIFVIFAVIMTAAGFGLVTSGGNQSALDAAKSKFQNGLIGIIIVFAGWLIVDTVLRGVLGGGATGAAAGQIVGWGPWSSVKCEVQARPTPYAREGANVVDPMQSLVSPPSAAVAGSLTQNAAEARLAGTGITVVSSANCTDRTRASCTSLDGVKENTLNRIIELQRNVGVPLIVTGGTEAGHAAGTYSHSNGYKIDLRPDPALNTYITTNFTQIGPTKYRDPAGNTYYRHPPDHWDITITK